jgi:hypothetical protein
MSFPPFETNDTLTLLPPDNLDHGEGQIIVVIGKHKYYNLFNAQLTRCANTARATLKGPFVPINPLQHAWKKTDPDLLKFYLAVTKFQTVYQKSAHDLESLQALVQNPAQYEFYFHDNRVSEKITARSLRRVNVANVTLKASVVVRHEGLLTNVTCDVTVGEHLYNLDALTILFDYFVVVDHQWYLPGDPQIVNVLAYFKMHGPVIRIAKIDFESFQQHVLAQIDLYLPVVYEHTATTPAGLHHTALAIKKKIYLSDLQQYVTITPVIQYGTTEIPIRSQRQVYTRDQNGKEIHIARDGALEDEMMALLLRQGNYFMEQFDNPLLYFYVSRHSFLNLHWFLALLEDWTRHDIQVLGFRELTANKFTPHRIHVHVDVISGLHWFNSQFDIRFGKTTVSLHQVQKALKNRSHYILLDDGTTGILPEEWVEKFKNYFRISEIENDNTLRLSKVNYTALDELYHARELMPAVKDEIAGIEEQFRNLAAITPVAAPPTLLGELRSYQAHGLSWLNLLDDMGFGGCLADDMGLGKSLQVIAFILLLKNKKGKRTHLIVVPTTLLVAWKDECAKFAPTLAVHIQHGASKISTKAFDEHDIILTSYGSMVSDILSLTAFTFDYIFLDESQNIKNPSSQRFKAALLLHGNNKITLSGTPFENNVWDLYAQFAFACPGLLGSRQYFRDMFAIPIGKFKSKRAIDALSKKIAPFILRRTKQEVSQELPEKTEMILYCTMSAGQRALYSQEERKFRDRMSAYTDDDIPKHALNILKGLTRLRLLCNSPALAKDEGASEEASGKLDTLIERIASLHKNHKILVFSQFVSMLDLIRERLETENITSTMLTGKSVKREKIISNFQTDDSLRVFLISLKAGGTGLNLTSADYVFIVDPWWNSAVENQAIDRLYRIGQTKNVVAVRLVCKDTIEEKIMTLKHAKDAIAKDLVLADGNLSALSRADIFSLLTQTPADLQQPVAS